MAHRRRGGAWQPRRERGVGRRARLHPSRRRDANHDGATVLKTSLPSSDSSQCHESIAVRECRGDTKRKKEWAFFFVAADNGPRSYRSWISHPPRFSQTACFSFLSLPHRTHSSLLCVRIRYVRTALRTKPVRVSRARRERERSAHPPANVYLRLYLLPFSPSHQWNQFQVLFAKPVLSRRDFSH
jgi:hypothetical protein